MDITLEKFSAENAELVLSWRNAKEIREHSLNNSVIKPGDHLAFLKKLPHSNNYFYILKIKNSPQGVLNVNRLNDGSALWGCYLAPGVAPRPGVFPLMIMTAGILAFERLDASELHSEVLAGNTPPLKINRFLGVEQTSVRQETRPSGEKIDVLCFRTQRHEWPALQTVLLRIIPQATQQALTGLRKHFTLS